MEVPYLATLRRKAELRQRAGLRRDPVPRGAAIDLAGNDYLGLSQHPQVIGAAEAALRRYGLGATGSRLVRGSTQAHAELEEVLAAWLGTPQALVYSSGYLANLGAIRGLCMPRTLLVVDEHAHASLIDGCRLAGATTGAETVFYPHGDPGAVAALLHAHGKRSAVVITESIFSVDGDLAPLNELHQVAREHAALLLVDDAHGLGVLGESGAGGVAAAGLAGQPDVIVTATLSKALGGAGGVVAAPEPLIRHLIDTSRTFIFDTALPPAVVAGVRQAVSLAQHDDQLRTELRGRVALIKPGLPGGVAALPASSAEAAVAWAAACREQGVAVGCFRPPSTPDKVSRLRLTVNAGVPRADFERALKVVRECQP